jgi:hypothetical protein
VLPHGLLGATALAVCPHRDYTQTFKLLRLAGLTRNPQYKAYRIAFIAILEVLSCCLTSIE